MHDASAFLRRRIHCWCIFYCAMPCRLPFRCDACRTHNVPYKKTNLPADGTYAIIAALLLDNMPVQEAAEKFKLTKQRISFIRGCMRKAGIPFGIRGLLKASKAKSKLNLE